jgi:hypothetical protein
MRADLRWEELLAKVGELAQRQAELSGRQVDPTLLLPGEDPTSPHADDAAHWATVYGELVEAKEAVCLHIREQKEEVSPAAKPELGRDEEAAELELERLRLHLDYWTARESS